MRISNYFKENYSSQRKLHYTNLLRSSVLINPPTQNKKKSSTIKIPKTYFLHFKYHKTAPFPSFT